MTNKNQNKQRDWKEEFSLPISLFYFSLINRKAYLFYYLISQVFFNTLSFAMLAQGQQVISDKTLSTTVTFNGQDFIITGGIPKGANLFHSFSEFSVPTGSSAFFNNAPSTENIISRVTGSSSYIDGLIKTNFPASLFLINPKGIVFGPNATLNVGGSFIASTASQITFADGTIFSATDVNNAPLLTTTIPVGLQFREKSGSIVNRSVAAGGDGLSITGKTIALIGGDIFLEGGVLTAIDGRIELGSVAAPALVSLSPISSGWALGYDSVQNFQTIQFSQGSVVQAANFSDRADILLHGREINLFEKSQIVNFNYSDSELSGIITVNASKIIEISQDSDIGAAARSDKGIPPSILINTRYLVIRDDSSFIDANSENDGRAGNIVIHADDSVEVDGGGGLNGIKSVSFDNGDAGILKIATGRLILRDGGQISSTTNSVGNGGVVDITATESILISGQGIGFDGVAPSGIFSRTSGDGATGDGGIINIKTSQLRINNGGLISVAAADGSTGQAGNLQINASELVELTGTNSALLATSQSPKPAGNIRITTPTLSINNGATISSSTFGQGNAGNIAIENAHSVDLDNGSISTKVESNALGQGGNINIQTHSLNLNNGAQINASTQGGRAGNLTVKAAESVQLNGIGGLSVEAAAGGTAGNLTVETRQMNVSDGAKVSVSSKEGQAGNLRITANSLNLNQGSITAETGKSGAESGANITLQLSNSLRLENESLISATANGDANGGNITINSPFAIAFPPTGANGNDIIANAERGNGGNIKINAQGIFGIAERPAIPGDQTNDIDASSEFGASGQVQINSTIDPNRGVIQLPETVVDPTTLIAQNPCKKGTQSELTLTGRGGLPPNPTDDLNPQVTQVGLIKPAPPTARPQPAPPIPSPQSKTQNPIIPAQGWVYNQKGEVVLTAYNPSVTESQRQKPHPTSCPAP